MRRILVLCLPLLVLAAAAQDAPGPSGPAISAGDDAVDVGIDQTVEVALTVTHVAGPPIGDRTFVVSVSGVPEGWNVAVDPAVLELAPGQSGSSTASISVTPDAASDGATLTFTATIVPFGLDPIPGIGALLDPASSASVTVEANRDDSITREALEAIGPWIWAILSALVILLIVVVMLVIGRRATQLTLDANEHRISLSGVKEYKTTLVLTNNGKRSDTALMGVSTVPDGWKATLEPSRIDLQAGDTVELTLGLKAPKGAAGSKQTILVTAGSGRAPGRPVTATIEVEVA